MEPCLCYPIQSWWWWWYKIVPFIFYFIRHTVHTKTSTAKKNLWNYGNLQDRNLVHLQKNTILECCELKILHIRIRKNFPDLHFFNIFSTKWSSYKADYILQLPSYSPHIAMPLLFSRESSITEAAAWHPWKKIK